MNPVATLLLFPFQPRRVALAHQSTPLWKIYVIHWLGLFVLAGVLIGLDYLTSHLDPSHTLVARTVFHNLDAAVIAFVVTLCGECVFVLIGTVMTCWAGADEPIGDTWRHALRVSWLFVAHLSWIVGGFGLTVHFSGEVRLRNAGASVAIAMMILTTILIWSIASYLRAMTVPRQVERVETDPMCEWCGYTVAYLDPTGRCPECGRPIEDSLRADTRKPFVYNDYPHAWLTAWTNPESIFRRVSPVSRSRDATVLLVRALAITAPTAGFALNVTVLSFERFQTSANDVFPILSATVATGVSIAWSCLMFASAAASGLGFIASRRSGRNRFAAGFTLVALTSGLIPPWACVAAVTLVGAMFKLPWRNENVVLMCVTFNAIVVIAYCRALARRMQFLQYANRRQDVYYSKST